MERGDMPNIDSDMGFNSSQASNQFTKHIGGLALCMVYGHASPNSCPIVDTSI